MHATIFNFDYLHQDSYPCLSKSQQMLIVFLEELILLHTDEKGKVLTWTS